MLIEFDLAVDYGQIFVNRSDAPSTGLIWTDEHTAQGFAWAPGIVCFGMPDPDEPCLVQVSTADALTLSPEALWAVRVPFVVPQTPIVVGSTTLDHEVPVEAGSYGLVFEALPGKLAGADMSYVTKLTFCRNAPTDFAILKQGSYLKTAKVLAKDAAYAHG